MLLQKLLDRTGLLVEETARMVDYAMRSLVNLVTHQHVLGPVLGSIPPIGP